MNREGGGCFQLTALAGSSTQTTSLQLVCPSVKERARRRVVRGRDCTQLGQYLEVLVLQDTESWPLFCGNWHSRGEERRSW